MPDPRLQSAFLLHEIFEKKVFFAEIKSQIAKEDLPFVNMLVLTVLRHYCGLREILYAKFLPKKIPHKRIMAEYLLLCGMAEILYLSTPSYAVVNTVVHQIKKVSDKFIANMANAVLHKVIDQKDDLQRKIESILAIPDSFRLILQGYSSEQIKKISDALFVQPPLDISVKTNPQVYAENLNAEILPNGSLRLYSSANISELPGYEDGAWWVQDAAAALAVQVMGNLKGKEVIDLCAAPGGKTAQLAAKGAKVTALDISLSRLQKLRQNMRRLKFNEVKVIQADAVEYLQNSAHDFDAILLDAPCSASGTFRRHPEVLHIKTVNDVLEQTKIQEKLLQLAARIVKPGGILLYCVCSIAKAEGEEQISNFLRQHQDYNIVPITKAELSLYGDWEENFILPNGTIRTLPYYEMQKKGLDSFFICKMQRII